MSRKSKEKDEIVRQGTKFMNLKDLMITLHRNKKVKLKLQKNSKDQKFKFPPEKETYRRNLDRNSNPRLK